MSRKECGVIGLCPMLTKGSKITDCDGCGHYHPEVPVECDISEYAYLTMDTPNECKQFAEKDGGQE